MLNMSDKIMFNVFNISFGDSRQFLFLSPFCTACSMLKIFDPVYPVYTVQFMVSIKELPLTSY